MLLCYAVFEMRIDSNTVCCAFLDTPLIGHVQSFLVSSIELSATYKATLNYEYLFQNSEWVKIYFSYFVASLYNSIEQ